MDFICANNIAKSVQRALELARETYEVTVDIGKFCKVLMQHSELLFRERPYQGGL